jgi:hypothetical protein
MKQVLAVIPIFTREKAIYTIVEIEHGGIWVESASATQGTLNRSGVSMLPKAPLYFVPFSGIGWILAAADYPALSEKIAP